MMGRMPARSPGAAFELPARPRWRVLPVWLLLPVLGLGSRSGWEPLPSFVAAYAGDTLWTMLVYVSLILLWPRLPLGRALGLAAGLDRLLFWRKSLE